ncbi:hypothetical protein B0A49_03301 [Cryomyces minteri]|uniref:GH16 domain-containing protein n=1 Tax=Cryomyces minteri TaxID=331657 RepID=A0A4U0XIT0_9PEZI|nr:hypothetical protein B0A49_03301 [Cryomyces minteri]
MPFGCGTWPAYWLLGPNWPSNGEIDIIEGVNTNTANLMSLHSSPNCTIAGSGQSGTLEQSNCDTSQNGNSGCGTKADTTAVPNNYGAGLNSIGGGVYAIEWTSSCIKFWFFPRTAIPASITAGTPNLTEFGLPMANAQGSCNLDSHFANHSIIINTDFCGAYAGNTYGSDTDCPQNATAGSSLNSCLLVNKLYQSLPDSSGSRIIGFNVELDFIGRASGQLRFGLRRQPRSWWFYSLIHVVIQCFHPDFQCFFCHSNVNQLVNVRLEFHEF